jgi:Fe2+ transport system protein FeoA
MVVKKSDLGTRISPPGAGRPPGASLRLAAVQPGRKVRVVAVPEQVRATLGQEGVVPGTELEVERTVGLGGPMIVRLGRARLAIARSVARGIDVEAAAGDPTSGAAP